MHASPGLAASQELLIGLLPRDDARVTASRHEQERDAERGKQAAV